MKISYLLAASFFACVGVATAVAVTTTTVVLQNFKNAYAGTHDTYLMSSDPEGFYGDNNMMLLNYERCTT